MPIVVLGGASAVVAGFTALGTAVTDLYFAAQGGSAVDLCGLPPTGFYLFWDRFGGLCLGALAVLLATAALALPFSVSRGKRLLAAALIVVTLGLSPVPWVIQIARQIQTVGCHQL